MRYASSSTLHAATLGLSLLCATACSRTPTPTPAKDSSPVDTAAASVVSTSAAAQSAAAARGPAPAAAVPVLGPSVFAPAESHPQALFAVEGALVVTEKSRVGRIAGDGIEWITKTIPTGGSYGGNVVTASISGRWPDQLDVIYETDHPRSPELIYFPLMETGHPARLRGGDGTSGQIVGMATIGATTLMEYHERLPGSANGWTEGIRISSMRGPKLARPFQTPAQAGCKGGEVVVPDGCVRPAVWPSAFAGSPAGTLMSLGKLCDGGKPAAEVWDKTGKSRVIDLHTWWTKGTTEARIVPGTGDDLWLLGDRVDPILRYHDGEITPLPHLEKLEQAVFVSASGQLHASDGSTIHRYGDSGWTPIARLPWPSRFDAMAIDKDTIWASALGAVYRLVPAPSVDFHEGCTTPFVYLYDVSWKNDPRFTYPDTRKALSTFAELSDLSLVEFQEGFRRLGVVVTSKAQGEAVIAHVRANMKNENPQLVCYEPRSPRKIDLKPKGK